ncbi:SAM-dependent methyltransferase [Aurantibacter crassamenti]|uniref:methyltransferase n=1 Tax=Aurantibacter crassamenti TaxID=1837375 RepID=UPI00193A502B|nr:methyltransferase [Aurantibacter crassamenti]MBM1105520.1 SAM-dependent methyltransferase [Aurantibacter crassamenti]
MSKKTIRAVDALQEAQKIAFAPFVFQTSVTLKNLGVLDYIFDSKCAVSQSEICEALSISEYGLSVLLEIAESSEIVTKDEDEKYELSKIGYFLNYHKMTEVNLNFTQDVCYQGLFHLEDTIKTGKPQGLKELGDWSTIYEGLSQLPPHIQKSWFDFDHFYSDEIFVDALNIIFKSSPKTIFDIGGNTGKFAIQCCEFNNDIQVKIYDLPGQLKKALANAEAKGHGDRVSGEEIDWLSENPKVQEGADIIWMSQFLDCFSKEEILKILSTSVKAMNADTELIIIETYTDRQKFGNAKFILEATSLYFTALANGNSKMYKATELIDLADKAGLTIKEDISLGEYHTMFICKKK